MVASEEFKKKIKELISQEYQIEFLGTNLDHIIELLTEIKAQKIYQWIEEILQRKVQPIVIGSKEPYKEWNANELLTFRYPFSIGNTEYRILLVKVKNSVYIEFHLGDHKYYDKVRKNLALTNN